jgi:hypothetical protein
MTEASLPPRLSLSDFRVGSVLNRTLSVLSRNFLTFFIVTTIAGLPTVLLSHSGMFMDGKTVQNPGQVFGMLLLSLFLGIVLYTFSQAIVLYGAFQDMRGRSVSLVESLQVGLRRFFPSSGSPSPCRSW